MAGARTSFGYYVGVVILVALLLAGAALIVAMVARPGTPETSVLAVTDRTPVACPDHANDVTCFETQVTNNGEADTTVRCEIRSTDGSVATFVNGGATTTQLLLGVDQSVQVDSVVEGDGARPPSVSCEPVSV
jgi:hypothetical protein